jgi:catechol 2,3-dioxygenase-like lactoylglutathione lyase family enzyme
VRIRLALLSCVLAFSGCRCASPPAADPDGGNAPPIHGEAAADPAALFGGERGLDHVGVAVRNLEEATHTYHDLLGFDRPIEGKLPNGLRNVNYYFGDSTYLETLSYWDREKAQKVAKFTDDHSGGLFAVLSVLSHESAAQFLSSRGIAVGQPISGTIQTAGEDAMPEEQWRTFFLPDGTLPGNPFFFIAYQRAPREEFLHKLEDMQNRLKLRHRNSALGIHSVWCAVADLAAATKAYESIGLVRGSPFDDPFLSADGQVLGAGAGEIWLFAPKSGKGKVADFLKERGEPGILGATIEVGSVAQAARVIGDRTGASLTTYEGVFGTSLRVGPELTQGIWLEFAHRRAPSAGK